MARKSRGAGSIPALVNTSLFNAQKTDAASHKRMGPFPEYPVGLETKLSIYEYMFCFKAVKPLLLETSL